MQKLIEVLDVRGTRQSVSLDKLNEFIRKASSQEGPGRTITPQLARDRYQGFDPKVRHYLQKISEFMKRNNITLQKMYEEIDINKDGSVDKMEFVNRLSYL
jgi:Ca2+-binding EF-hand superfamily protein